MLPELEDKQVVGINHAPDGFVSSRQWRNFTARRVVLAVGITHFEYVPESLWRICRRNFCRIASAMRTRKRSGEETWS
jgi:hypothetical protein